MNTETTVTVTVATRAAEYEFDVTASGNVSREDADIGGTVWVEDVTLARENGEPLPKRVLAALDAGQWDAIRDALADAGGY